MLKHRIRQLLTGLLLVCSLSFGESYNAINDCETSDGKTEPRSLDSQQPLRLLTWNIHKLQHPSAQQQLEELSQNIDLLLLQEAILNDDFIASINSHFQWRFSPGYHNGTEQTGVLTASNATPLEHCSQIFSEPWLKTPKAVGITRFAIAESGLQLLVINLHGINFEWGLTGYGRQLNYLSQVIEEHRGPLIFAGDFNTWGPSRQLLIDNIAAMHDLTPARFKEDLRKQFWGHKLDHVYFRGFEQIAAATPQTDTSDHNPIVVQLRWLQP